MNTDPDLNDLLSDEAVNHPISYYDKVRAVSPVYWNPRWNGWIVTGYEEVTTGYRNWEKLSSDRFSGPFGGEVRAAADERSQLFSFLTKFFVWKDPPYQPSRPSASRRCAPAYANWCGSCPIPCVIGTAPISSASSLSSCR
jgi:hypothetical protein